MSPRARAASGAGAPHAHPRRSPARCHPPAAAPAPFLPSPAKLLSFKRHLRAGSRALSFSPRIWGGSAALPPARSSAERPRPPLLLLWWAAGGCGGRAAAAAGSAPAPAAADRGGCAQGSWRRPLENGILMCLLFLFFLSFFLWRCGLRPLGWHRRRQGYAPTPLLFHEVRGEETGSAAFPAPGPGQRRAGGARSG